MALSARNDNGQSGAEEENVVKKTASTSEHKNKHDSGIYLDPGICFSPYEVMDNLNHGSVPISHSSPSSEGAAPPLMDINFLPQVEDNESQVPKKHIAYHLLSNLLDDEITDDSRSGVQEARTSRTDGGEVFDSAGSWPPSMSSFSSNFSLNLELHDNTNHGSLSGRSIHEIWSPNPSPKGSYPSTPSEDSVPYFSSHENRESPYHNRSPVDIIVGRRNGSPMLSSPCSLPSDQSFMHYHSRIDNPQYYSSGFTSLDSFNNNHTIGNGLESSHEFENGKGYPRHNMHAIRALQFVEPGIESNRDGTSEASEPASPGCSEDSQQGRGKNRRSFVHFEEKDCSSAKQKNGYILASHECMMPAAKRLGSGLDECLEQLRHLEKECRKAEQELSKIYPPRRRSSSNGGVYHTRLPTNPTRVDKMIIEQLKVHNKVESLIGRIERLGRRPLHSNVGVALDRWLACIRELQGLRKNEMNHSPGTHVGSYGCKSFNDQDLLMLGACVKELAAHTREARTTVWCATQMLHSEDCWVTRQSESCGSIEPQSDLSSEKS